MIVGARPIMDEGGFTQKKDSKGRYEWDMPEPIGVAQHKRRVKVSMQFGDKVIRVPQTEIVEVPVYRGYSTRFLNYVRSRRKYEARQYLKKMEKQAENELRNIENFKEESGNAAP